MAEPLPGERGVNLAWLKAVLRVDRSVLKPRAKLVATAVALAAYSKDPRFHGGLTFLESQTSMSRSSVQRGLDDLVAAGLLIQRTVGSNTHGNRASVYALSMPD